MIFTLAFETDLAWGTAMCASVMRLAAEGIEGIWGE
jgi:hypothetical protein